MSEKLIFELSCEGRTGADLPELDVPERPIDEMLDPTLLRGELDLPSLSEIDTLRHFVRLSSLNHHILKGFYPLGSCTMKYNPVVNETISRLPGFTSIHPLLPEEFVQGALMLMYELGEMLKDIGGMDAITLQPAAGAHGELTGTLIMRAYFKAKHQQRKYVIIPDSSHGTNPASIAMAGFEPVEIKSNEDGNIDIQALESALSDEVAGMMVTNPNTLGIFEREITKVAELIHSAGGILYMDGANLNAIMGIVRPGELGVDILHYNLHKTFSTPHGGGGPGGGPIAVKSNLADFLPVPIVTRTEDGRYSLNWNNPHSIGKILCFWGNFLVMVKAYAYIKSLGSDGVKHTSEMAVLNSNYLLHLLKDKWELPYPSTPMHEFVLSGEFLKRYGVKTLDVAKRLLDMGFHAPTIYFPLIVHEALMIEPTETESRETLEDFASAMNTILEEAKEKPELLRKSPMHTPVRRLDELKANKELKVKWKGGKDKS